MGFGFSDLVTLGGRWCKRRIHKRGINTIAYFYKGSSCLRGFRDSLTRPWSQGGSVLGNYCWVLIYDS
jgi:hypothetical protein